MTNQQKRRQQKCSKRSAYRNVMAVSAVLSCLALSCLAVGAIAQEQETPIDKARTAIERHPSVTALRAEVCQSASQVDLAKSRLYPQADFRLTGGKSIDDTIKTTDVRSRRFDNDDIDGVIAVNQTLYDWGITTSSIGIARNARSAAKIGVELESDRIAADILSTMVTRQELIQQSRFYEDYERQLALLAERIEAGVEAGANRLSDLRRIKINQLDADVAHNQILRQLELTEAELIKRTELTFDDAMPLYLDYIANRALEVPTLESEETREVRRLDLNAQSNKLELRRTKAELLPSMTAILEGTLFDVDTYDNEHEIVARVQMNLPLYDGGSNKARQNEHIWRGRSIDSERQNLIRNHQSQTLALLQRFEQISENLAKLDDKIGEVEHQLEGALARQGQTENNPLGTAAIYTDLNGLFVERLTLEKELELERLRGIFFADRLGATLSLSYGLSLC